LWSRSKNPASAADAMDTQAMTEKNVFIESRIICQPIIPYMRSIKTEIIRDAMRLRDYQSALIFSRSSRIGRHLRPGTKRPQSDAEPVPPRANERTVTYSKAASDLVVKEMIATTCIGRRWL
jgi:hypothetical protein